MTTSSPDSFTAPPPKAHSRRSALIVSALLAVVLFFCWPHLAAFRWDLFLQTLRCLDSRWLLGGAALSLLAYIVRAIRWRVLMLPAPGKLARILNATFIGFSGVVLLGRAGEVVRPVLIARQERTTVAAQFAVWVLERLYDLLLILLLFGISLAESDAFDLAPGSRLRPVFQIGGGLVTLSAGAATGILFVLARHPENFRAQILKALSFLPQRLIARLASTLDSFLSGAQSIRSGKIAAASLALTVVEWATLLGSVWCYFQAHPACRSLNALDVAVFLGFVSIGNIVQLPGIGGGVQVASLVTLTELFHLHFEVAAGLSLLIWAGTSLLVLPIGIPLALAGHIRFADLRPPAPKPQNEPEPVGTVP